MNITVETHRLPTPGRATEDVTAAVHTPSKRRGPAFLLLPGAGGDLDTPGLVGLAEAIAELGHLVVRANLPYREAGRRPPRADRSIPGFRATLAGAHALAPRTPWVVGGKSYGGRVASMAVAEGARVAGLIFYGYPLHPPGKPEALRVDHWADIAVPCLFLQGERDVFGGPDEVAAHVDRLPRRATVHGVPGGDHSLVVTKAASPDGVASRAEATTRLVGPVVASWIASLEAVSD